MTIWALADLHLSFGTPNKSMELFGEDWLGWTDKIKSNWQRLVKPDDLVLIAGDISWAMSVEQAKPDLEWIDQLPGTKVMIRGNHDYWWGSLSKVKSILPPSIHVIQNDAFQWKDVSIAGARLWDSPEYNFNIYAKESSAKDPEKKGSDNKEEDLRIWERELARLELSLKCLNSRAKKRIVMTHYPPISGDLRDSKVHAILKNYGVDICVFGHLHNMKKNLPIFGEKKDIQYYLTAGDYLDFVPLKIF